MQRQILLSAVAMIVATVLLAAEAFSIPAFSRKYNVGCNLCHSVFPRLNELGRDFKNNGYRTADEVEPTKEEKDFWDKGFDLLPVTVHGKINQEFAPKGAKMSNATTLDELQLNAGINFSSKVSFYMHTHLWEEGEVGKPLVVAVRINDLFNTPLLNVRAGQFELPLSFSPEIERLMATRYLVFAQSIGANGFTLEGPQLGVELSGDLGRDFWYWIGVVNGSGFETNPFTGTFDNNSAKDPYFRLAKNFGENTIGVFGYLGNNAILLDEPDSLGFNTTDRFIRVGGDVNWNFSDMNIRSTFMYGRDKNFNGLSEATSFYGGFVECNYYATDRLVILGRYDEVQLENVAAAGGAEEEGAAVAVQKTNWAITPGFQYLVLPNIKVGLEYQFRREREQERAVVLLHFAI